MAGETILSEAICLAIKPWSKTSHVVDWLTPAGRITTLVKGAVRPKSAFLGQYDLNYTCEILYYARARGDLHALRECAPLCRRDSLRGDYRALALADYWRSAVRDMAPNGPECEEWFDMLREALDSLTRRTESSSADSLRRLIAFETDILRLAGLSPNFEKSKENGFFQLRGERRIPVTGEVMQCIRQPWDEKNIKILLDATRVIGVFYIFHLDCASDLRRTVLRMICN